MIKPADRQRPQLDQPGVPCDPNPQSNETYVLLESVEDDDGNWAEDCYPAAMEAFAHDGWDDPRMDAYAAS